MKATLDYKQVTRVLIEEHQSEYVQCDFRGRNLQYAGAKLRLVSRLVKRFATKIAADIKLTGRGIGRRCWCYYNDQRKLPSK